MQTEHFMTSRGLTRYVIAGELSKAVFVRNLSDPVETNSRADFALF
jgi:hypothetical protein